MGAPDEDFHKHSVPIVPQARDRIEKASLQDGRTLRGRRLAPVPNFRRFCRAFVCGAHLRPFGAGMIMPIRRLQ
jgi:hypothetical protein